MTLQTGERSIPMTHPALRYTGRIGREDPEHPFFIHVCSGVQLRLTGRTLRIALTNRHSYYENRLGVIVNGVQHAVLLAEGPQEIDLSGYLTGEVSDVLLFKRQDACHAFTLDGLAIAGELLPLPARPARRIEVYGDSVSAGEVSEAEFACARPDPEGHDGRYSNGYLSYAWQAARLMNAELHAVAQGGLALLDGTGYYDGPDYIGLESCWDKVNYAPCFGPVTDWDFARFTPQVVIVAVGQNDHHPANIMAEDYHSAASVRWRSEYCRFLGRLRERYPHAHILCTTTILGHDPAWDRAIGECAAAMGDARIRHFLYTNNGCGTPGHVRGSEAAVMARELADFIEALPGVWEGSSKALPLGELSAQAD